MTLTNLRVIHRFRARGHDVEKALRDLNPVTTALRRPGMKPTRTGEYLIPKPNFLWSINGHDKFRNYGIGIYAAINAYSRKFI